MSSLAHREEKEGEAMSGKREAGSRAEPEQVWVGKAVSFGVVRCSRIKSRQQPCLRQLIKIPRRESGGHLSGFGYYGNSRGSVLSKGGHK